MSADVAINYSDSRQPGWIQLAPQSWLSDYWQPIAEDRDWYWVRRACDNTCQASEPEEFSALLAQMRALQDVVASSDSIDAELANDMKIRLERVITSLAVDEESNWQNVDFISIG